MYATTSGATGTGNRAMLILDCAMVFIESRQQLPKCSPNVSIHDENKARRCPVLCVSSKGPVSKRDIKFISMHTSSIKTTYITKRSLWPSCHDFNKIPIIWDSFWVKQTFKVVLTGQLNITKQMGALLILS